MFEKYSLEKHPEKIRVKNRIEAFENAEMAGLEYLKKSFCGGCENPMDYHIWEHSSKTADLAEKILKVINQIEPKLVPEDDISLTRLLAIYHDIVQRAVLEPGQLRKRLRGYEAGGNEYESAKILLEQLEQYIGPDGKPLFLDSKFKDQLIEDVLSTYPDFSMQELPDGTKGLKIFQPLLKPEGSLRAFALAMADLRGDVGTRDFETFKQSGNAEFRELFVPIKEQLKSGVEKMTVENKAKISSQILDWKKSQIGFAKWQKIIFDQVLNENQIINASNKKGGLKQKLKEIFSQFDQNIQMTENYYKEMEEKLGYLREPTAHQFAQTLEDFKLLLADIGFTANYIENLEDHYALAHPVCWLKKEQKVNLL